jgi:hypothetical protein
MTRLRTMATTKYPVSPQWTAFRKRLIALGAYGLDASGPNLPGVGSRFCYACLKDWRYIPMPHTYREGCSKAPTMERAA